jgi:Peptidase A4 family
MGGFAIDAVSGSAQTVKAKQQQSQNWAGCVGQSSTGKSFSSVSGSWTQPTATSSSGTARGYSAFWVGLGGANGQSQSLEQVGASTNWANGKAEYYAWYELLPSAEVKLSITIHPGDHISGKVTVNGTTVTISLSDQTTGQSVTKSLQMSHPDTSSAEWIVEAPSTTSQSAGDQVLPLADFGKVTFTGASATADGHTGSISDPNWSVQQV